MILFETVAMIYYGHQPTVSNVILFKGKTERKKGLEDLVKVKAKFAFLQDQLKRTKRFFFENGIFRCCISEIKE